LLCARARLSKAKRPVRLPPRAVRFPGSPSPWPWRHTLSSGGWLRRTDGRWQACRLRPGIAPRPTRADQAEPTAGLWPDRPRTW